MEILIPIFIAIYVAQLIVFGATITADAQYSGRLPKIIATKKQALYYLIPFGFSYVAYVYYKKLD